MIHLIYFIIRSDIYYLYSIYKLIKSYGIFIVHIIFFHGILIVLNTNFIDKYWSYITRSHGSIFDLTNLVTMLHAH